MPKKKLYKIPKEMDVLRISIEILEEYGIVNSLKMLTALVNMRARSEKSLWRISQKRLKKIVAKSRKIRIDLITRETGDRLEGEVCCVVCGEKMEEELNRTLYGGTVVLGYVCPHCGYRTDTTRRVPIRYVFRIA